MNYSSMENHHPQQQQQQTMDYYSAYYQQQYDPSSQYYHTNNSSYNYSSYAAAAVQPLAAAVQPLQHEEQQPNPPGVTSYYQYPLPISQPPLALHYQSIVHPQEIPQSQAQAQALSGSRPNAFNNRPFRGRGRGRGSVRGRGGGRGRAQSLNRPVQDQTIYTEGAAHVQGWAPQPMPQYPAPPVPPKVLRCEVCKIGCDTIEIFEQHKNGKKHQKNMKKITNGMQMEMLPNSNMSSGIPLQPNQVEENVNLLGLPGQSRPLNIQSQPRSAHVPSKTVSCELCNVDCNTPEIFETHKNGKKHQKKLRAYEELQRKQSVTPFVQAAQTSTTEVLRLEVPSQPEKIDGPGDPQSKEETLSLETNKEGNKVEAENKIAQEMGPAEQESAVNVNADTSEGKGKGTKRKMRGKEGRRTKPCKGSKRHVDSSKPKEAVPLICELCNVRCDTQAVFQCHLVGRKHQLKAKRFLTPHEILGQEILAALALTPALQGLLQQNAIASTSVGHPLYNQGFGPLGSLPGGLAQNLFNAGASASGANMENLNQLQPLSADNIAPQLVNTEGKLNEGNPECQRENIYHSTGGLVQQTEHIASGPANGAFELEKNVGFEPLPKPDAITEQNPTEGGDSAH